MEVLNIIFNVVAVVANGALTFFAINAWFALHRMEQKVNGMSSSVAITTALTMGEHVRKNFEEVNRMKETFQHLVDTEQYEEAQELQGLIMNAEREAEASLKCFKEICGDSIVDVIVTSVKRANTEEL